MQGAELRITREGEVAVAALDGEIDLVNAAEIGERLSAGVDGASGVIFDLEDVAFMDSQAIALLDRLSASLEARGCPVAIVAPPESVPRRVLEIVDLGVDLFDEASAAHAAVSMRAASSNGSARRPPPTSPTG